jgi:hypothetical protein
MVVLSTPRLRFLPWILLVAVVILFVFHGLACAAVDPLSTAQTSVDGGVGLVVTYGPVLGGMYLLYQLASRLVAKYASSSWFAKGKRLAITTGVLGVAGATLQAQIGGSPWNVIALAGIAAAFKLLTPTVPSASDPTLPPARVLKAGTLSVLILVLGIGGGVVSGYGCSPPSTAVLNAAFDCTTQARKDLAAALTPTAVTAIHEIADLSGTVTVDALKTLFSGASLDNEVGGIVACVEARAVEFIAPLLPTPGVATAALTSDKGSINGLALRAALAAQFLGVVFKT